MNLLDWLKSGYDNYVASNNAFDIPRDSQPYEDWARNNLVEFGLPANADPSQYEIDTRNSIGSNWDGKIIREVKKDGAPVYTNSWDNGGTITPGQIAMTGALLFGGSAALANALGAAGASAAASSAPTLGEVGSSLSGLASPAEMGMTAVAPSVSAADIAALGSGIPGAVGGGGLAAAGGVQSLGSAWSPQALGLTGGITPGVSASELASLSQALPGVVSAGIPTAAAGSADKAALYGSDGYGPGMTGAQTSAYDSTLGVTGSKAAADAVANSSIGSGLLNGAKSITDLVGGAGNLATLAGAALGASSANGSQQTSAIKMDPRMEAYIYGSGVGDPNSLLGAAQKQFLANPSGINPTMQQGLDMQRAALTDPAYAQSFQQMRTLGNGLLSAPVAANPFTQTQAQSGGLLGSPSTQNLMYRGSGRGLI